MNQKFQAAINSREEMTYVKLTGVIDEDNELTDLTEKIPSGTAVINLGEIERINSCGVRDWVNWLGKIEKQGARVVLVECSPAIVAQINLVNNFTGGGVVKSFFAPYFCPNCDREKVLLVEASELGSPAKAPTCRCDECDGVMDFDDMEDSYFAFLTSAKKVADAAKIQAVVAEMNGADEKSKIRSRVGSTGGGGLGANLATSASSLPSVPSLPSLRTNAGSTPGTLPGIGGSNPGRVSFTGGASSIGGVQLGMNGGASSSSPAEARVSAQQPVTQPKAGKMVYVLVVLLLAAIAVLAVLLFSGGSSKKTTEIERPASVTRLG
jgi:anti-anti-sigma regulatory factor